MLHQIAFDHRELGKKIMARKIGTPIGWKIGQE
jgi:hypothetical protein